MNSSGKSNEQEVVHAREKIESLKGEYISILTPIVLKKSEKNIDPSLEELLECKKRATAYFNYVENFVGDSGLLGAHDNGLWVTGFAEDCFAILETIVIHYDFLRSYGEVFSGVNIEPSKSSYANMQRIIVEYLPKKTSKTIKQTFEEHRLPTIGFNMPASEDIKKIPTWQIVTGVVFGCIARAGLGCLNSLLRFYKWISLHWLCCLGLLQRVKVNLIRGLAVKARMWPAAVVKVEISIQSRPDG